MYTKQHHLVGRRVKVELGDVSFIHCFLCVVNKIESGVPCVETLEESRSFAIRIWFLINLQHM